LDICQEIVIDEMIGFLLRVIMDERKLEFFLKAQNEGVKMDEKNWIFTLGPTMDEVYKRFLTLAYG